ncbi:MAG: GNAT family protein [Pseudomonadota bacterium]
MTQPVLTTARLVLRPFQADDIDPLHTLLSDVEAMRYWGPHQTRTETEAFVRGTMAAPPAITCDFVIERDGAVIGKAGMWQAPEIGFFVSPAHQRQGVAREALGVVIPHLFSVYDMPALTADVDPRNDASRACLAAMGFRETGWATQTIEIMGEWCDSVYLALPRSVWAGC